MKTDIQLNAEAIRLRKRLGQDASSPVDIFRLILSDENLTLIFLPMGDRISGISIRLDNNAPGHKLYPKPRPPALYGGP